MTRYEELNGAYSNHIKDRHVVLFSGGLDSTATAVKLMQKNIKPLLLTIDTGAQDMPESIKIAREIAKELGLQQAVTEVAIGFTPLQVELIYSNHRG